MADQLPQPPQPPGGMQQRIQLPPHVNVTVAHAMRPGENRTLLPLPQLGLAVPIRFFLPPEARPGHKLVRCLPTEIRACAVPLWSRG